VTISLPPLRERRSDIPILATFFLERLAPARSLQISSSAMKALLAYDWPGNVRELENCLERAVALGDQSIIEVGDLPPAIANAEAATEALAVPEFSGRATDLRATDWKISSAQPSSASFRKSRETRLWRARCSGSAAPRCIASSSATASAPARIRRSRRHCNRFLLWRGASVGTGDSQACLSEAEGSKPSAVRQRAQAAELRQSFHSETGFPRSPRTKPFRTATRR